MAEFDRKNWDLDFRAELYKEEFYATQAWASASRRDALVGRWNRSTTEELRQLREVRKERLEHIGEIVTEQQSLVMVGLWYDLLEIGPESRPRTSELLHATIHLGGSVAGYFKDRFNRVRPWVLAPELFPPIPSPGLPAYPSGHSTQIYLMARTLQYLVPNKTTEITSIADRVAANRERAGLNYRSDTDAGKELADRVFEILTSECEKFMSLLEEAKQKEWGAATYCDATPREAILRT
jgi:hypothetical protein